MSTKNTSHSVNFDGDNLIFDLIFPDNMMIQEFSESLVNSFIFQQGFSDASSNASATLEMPLENFQDIFRIRLNSTNIAFENFEYYIDYTKWNFNTLAQSEVPFSLAIVDDYDGSLNRGPINPSHSNQSLKRDMARHVFQAIPNVQRLNNLQQFQHSIIQMIENMDKKFNEEILNKLKTFSDTGYRGYNDISLNPLKILVGTTFEEGVSVGIDGSENNVDVQNKFNVLTNSIQNSINNHIRNISQYAYYVDSSYGYDTLKYFGPIFLSKDTALTTAYALQRFVNFEDETVDGFALVEVSFQDYPDYIFYTIPGTKYDKGSYKSYDDLSTLETNITTLIQFDIWKGNFVDYTNIEFSYPFEDGDQISLLIEYIPDSLNFQIFNETFSNFGNNVIDSRTYQIFLKFKQTKVVQTIALSFTSLFLSILQNKKYTVNTIIDIVRIRIELELKIYHKNVNTLTSEENSIIEELKNTTSLPYILIAIQNWQYWYNNWYLIGNPINERQVVQNNIIQAKTELTEISQTSFIIDFLLGNIE